MEGHYISLKLSFSSAERKSARLLSADYLVLGHIKWVGTPFTHQEVKKRCGSLQMFCLLKGKPLSKRNAKEGFLP